MNTRHYGTSGPFVVVLHGGPGAMGYMTAVARKLAGSFRVLEPQQRGSGMKPLTVARHVADLHQLVESHCETTQPALVGHSWGAMLALAYAAAHPDRVGPLALVGCGTFDPIARDRMQATCEQRMNVELRLRIQNLPVEIPNPNERMRRLDELTLPLYSHELVATDLGVEAYDARAHQESWEDMVRMQEEGVYPAAFAAIDGPVIMLHGTVDPHPGRMIRASLKPHLPQLEYHEWERCGHYPWMERAIGEEFFDTLRQWLTRQFSGNPDTADP